MSAPLGTVVPHCAVLQFDLAASDPMIVIIGAVARDASSYTASGEMSFMFAGARNVLTATSSIPLEFRLRGAVL